MHIPNGFLSDPVCTVSTLTAAAAVGISFARLRESDTSRSAAMMAATGAGIFAAQMVNFPLDQGTSGHVIGAAVAAIALGPWRGMLTMAMVLAVQCLLFGDGGLQVLGANILNMGVIATLVASVAYTFVTRRMAGTNGKLLGAGVAALGSVLAAALACSLELAASGTFGLTEVVAAMLSVHAMIALCEGLITVTVVAAAIALSAQRRPLSSARVMIVGLAVAIAVAGLLAPLASSSPDGLERVAEDLNFANLATGTSAILADYEAPGIPWPSLAIAVAGMGGVLCVFASTYTVGRTAKVRVRKQ